MAQVTTYVCDVDHGEEDEHAASDVRRIGLGGVWREVDVCEDGAKFVDELYMPLMKAGRAASTFQPGRRSQGAARGSTKNAGRTAARERNRAIREYAKGKGIQVSVRGQIPQPVIDAYELDHPDSAVPAPV